MKDISELRLGIAGLGLIGGSLASALRGYFKEIYAWDIDPGVLEKGLDLGISFISCETAEEFANSCDVILLAVPLRYMEEISKTLRPLFKDSPPVAVMDVGSTKKEIGEIMISIWGSAYIGLHPMAGKEYSGIEQASRSLFQDARCAVVSGKETDPQVIEMALKIVSSIGSMPVFLDPEEHDSIVASVSHIPIMVASALAYVSGEQMESHPDLSCMVAGGFSDTTRLASGPAWLLADMWDTNSGNMGKLLDRLIDTLRTFREASPEVIEEMAEKARLSREKILSQRIQSD